MSRSQPTNHEPNPAVRWFDWQASSGLIRYYDKEAKKVIECGSVLSFLLLDQVGSVRGWHEPSLSGLYSNEVRDTTKDVLVVKSFKAGTLLEGIYKSIKDKVHVLGGSFVANCYVAVKIDDVLSICSLRFKGSSLAAWMEFTKAHRHDLYTKAIVITGYTEGKKGSVKYRVPTFGLKDVSPETQHQAEALDRTLQTFLRAYFERTTRERAEEEPTPESDAPAPDVPEIQLTDADIPF